MNYFDAHIHLDSLTYENLKDMSIAGVSELVSPVHISNNTAISPETVVDMWNFLLERQIERAKLHGITAYAMIGICMVAIPRSGWDDILKLIPLYLKKKGVVAIGEVGFEPTARTFHDHDTQKSLLERQIEIAKNAGIVLDIHTAHAPADKAKFTEESLVLCKEHGLDMNHVVIDHCSEANIDITLKYGAYVAITVQPWRGLTPEIAADLIMKYNSDHVFVDSDCSLHQSDPLSVPKTAYALRIKGASESLIEKACRLNARSVYLK
jgi:predicted metal-dependent TIM-barrel fold hydrolase